MTGYMIITPVRDEEKHIEATIASVLAQTVLPSEWVIVNDGSTDRTGAIVDRYAKQHRWIRVLHRPDRGFRKSGGGVVEAFYAGYSVLGSDGWDYIVKLDADLSFPENYFEQCFERFDEEPRLGIAGGGIYHTVRNQLMLEASPRFHVRGATKIYRKECWNAIGGLWRGPGWDTIDEVKANQLGWQTRTFTDLCLLHHRPTGTAEGLLRDRVKHGMACYMSGYHPLFLAAKSVSKLVQKPYLLGSAAILFGYLSGYAKHAPRVEDASLVEYLRRQQLRRLCGLDTIWK